ncbi:MAG TPA: glutamine-hydrolyzing carbamoyl-phosphate synthase small subunit [Phycisphaerae bacterium]|nr:glutamine-hydrolyzing carbamoyl-phosphate synthase small subunit [Phycisphaerae bacterium]
MICKLALENGFVFSGQSFGATGTSVGEVVFNTSLTGYQEIFTDPSYCGQIVTMTFPQIGNYGVNPQDFESLRPQLSGFVVKDLPRRPSNFRATGALEEFLIEHNVIGISNIDTRAIARRIRSQGAVRGVISTEISDEAEMVRLAREAPSMEGANLAERVASETEREWTERLGEPTASEINAGEKTCHVVALDCGIKHNILRHLAELGCQVTVAPPNVSAGRVRELAPDGILVGNGPGDPAAVGTTIELLAELAGDVPILGICLGHQMLALALGAKTFKLNFGHHGGNLPVLNKPADRVEITSQNHGFAVDAASLEGVGAEITHINLNDQSVEGFIHADKQIMTVQFHPEASPGPHDAAYVFAKFVDAVRNRTPVTRQLLI